MAPADCCLATVRHLSLVGRLSFGPERCPRLIRWINRSIINLLSPYHAIPFVDPTRPPYFSASASAARAHSCSINSIARARTRSSLFSYARINGSIDPGGADCAQVSKARSLVPTSGESRSLAIHAGTTSTSTGTAGFEDGTGAAEGLSPPRTIPFPDAEPVPLTEARGTELAARVNGSLRGDGLCSGRGGPPALARGPRFGALSDEAGPQPASPARSIRLMNGARRGYSRRRRGRDGCMSSNLSGDAGDENVTGQYARSKPTLPIVKLSGPAVYLHWHLQRNF